MKVGIIFPIYHNNDLQVDFTKQAIESVYSENHTVVVYPIINFSRPEFYPKAEKFPNQTLKIMDNPHGNHVGGAWNYGIKTALDDGCQYVIVANNDIVFHHSAIDNLVEFGETHKEFILWTANEWIDIRTINGVKEGDIKYTFDEHPHFSCFMVNKNTIDIAGWFDENIKVAYFEDSDMHSRILLSGNKAGKTASSLFYHYGSRTIKTDDELYDINKSTYEENREYMRQKWNVDFHQTVFSPPEQFLTHPEAFKTPFNDPNMTIKDW
jgi:GT2 family glycosyltransferase